MSIRLLPQNLINQIAAGEVVERPASALKELIENAIDAGSTRIDVVVNDGGKSYFSVSDNGKGIAKEELSLAIERHATSKLPTDDLFQINFLGFRGEALPSIGSVARLSITSRPQGAENAWRISVEGGNKSPLVPVGRTFGTLVEVKDLFFATPARLKFLKSPQTEQGYMKDVVNRIAMAYPNIHFSFSDEKRLILNYPAVQSLFMRVCQVIGKSFDENAIPINAEYEGIKLSGFVGIPTYTRSTSVDQYLFVNGRFIKDKVVIGAVRGAFQGLISHEKHPVLALFLSVPAEDVDVNVHPAKTEVRFKDSARIRGMLVASIRTALAEKGCKTASTIGIGALEKSFSQAQNDSFPRVPKPHTIPSFNVQEANKAGISYRDRKNYNPNQTTMDLGKDGYALKSFLSVSDTFGQTAIDLYAPNLVIPDELSEHSTVSQTPDSTKNVLDIFPLQSEEELSQPIDFNYNEPRGELRSAPSFSERIQKRNKELSARQEEKNISDFPPLGFAKAQLHKTYIVSQTPDSIIITDQHAAHERLTYEKLMQNMQGTMPSQLLLIPQIIDLRSDTADLLLERAEELKSFGFVFDPFGGDSIAVREIPALLNKTDIKTLLIDLADTLKEFDDTVLLKDKVKDICARMACHGSVRAGRELSIEEMNALLRQMESCPTAGQCIHGRPTYIELKLADIERLFGRTK